jgi:two-component system, OmpR family, phosphate regulon sensor histidine kinase PhoR
VREVTLALLPAAAAILVLAMLEAPWLVANTLAATAALGVAIAVATVRQQERLRIEAWLEGLGSRAGADRTAPPPATPTDPDADGIVRPVAGLARRLGRAERDNAARQRLIEQLVEALPDPILLVDGALQVVQANTAARRSFAIAALPAQVGLVLRDPGVLAALGAALDGKSASDLTFRPAVDQRKQFAARIERVDLPEGGNGALLALREETEQVMIERMRSDFVANASHEIRNPLASLVGFIETLQGPAKDDPAARESFLAIMAEETARMSRLVDDLLSLSRIELAADQPPGETCDVAEIVARVFDSIRPFAARYEVTLERQGDTTLPAVQGTPDQLHQLFTNLVDNAVKYGGNGKTVVIETAFLDPAPPSAGALAGRRAVAVSVTDHGPGIAAEHIPRLTERFYRVDKARSRHAGGTGLGLAIVKHIVRRHRGELTIESELGQGSTFRVLLPAL